MDAFQTFIQREIKNNKTSRLNRDQNKDIDFFVNGVWLYCIKGIKNHRQIISELFQLIYVYRDNLSDKKVLKAFTNPSTSLTPKRYKDISTTVGGETKAKELLKSVGFTEEQISEITLSGEHSMLIKRTEKHLIKVKKDLINYPFKGVLQAKLLKAINDFLKNPHGHFPQQPTITANVDDIRAFLEANKISQSDITLLINHINPA